MVFCFNTLNILFHSCLPFLVLSYSKWLSKQSNESASNFVLSLNLLLWKLFRWFRRLLWAPGDSHLQQVNVPTHASHLVQSFLVKHQITQVTQSRYSPDLVPCDFWLFLKLKSPLNGKKFHTIWWGSKKYDGAADGDWENYVRSQGACFEEDGGVNVLCTMFLVSCIFFSKCLYFSYYMAAWILWPSSTNIESKCSFGDTRWWRGE